VFDLARSSKRTYRRKLSLLLELKQRARAWVFTKIADQILECLTDSKKTVPELNKYLQQLDAAADDIAWAYRRHADLSPDLVIRYPRFMRAGFLPLFVQQPDSGHRTGYLFGLFGRLKGGQSFLKDFWRSTLLGAPSLLPLRTGSHTGR
jgi:hypothetical protein